MSHANGPLLRHQADFVYRSGRSWLAARSAGRPLLSPVTAPAQVTVILSSDSFCEWAPGKSSTSQAHHFAPCTLQNDRDKEVQNDPVGDSTKLALLRCR